MCVFDFFQQAFCQLGHPVLKLTYGLFESGDVWLNVGEELNQ